MRKVLLYTMVNDWEYQIVVDDNTFMFHGLLAMKLVLFLNVSLDGADNVLDCLRIS